MDILKLGAELLGRNLDLGPNISPETIMAALKGLLGNGAEGGVDLAGLMSKMQGSGLGGMLASFLGDGANDPMDAAQVTDVFGADKVDAFAGALNIAPQAAAEGLSATLPDLINQLSSGGNLLEGLTGGDSGGLLGMAKKLFG